MQSRKQCEREVLNTLATMPPHTTATILGIHVERFDTGYFVAHGESTMLARGAAKRVVDLSGGDVVTVPAGKGHSTPPNDGDDSLQSQLEALCRRVAGLDDAGLDVFHKNVIATAKKLRKRLDN